MKEHLVSFELAMKAKELGFNEPCQFYYWEHKKDTISTGNFHANKTNAEIIRMSESYLKGLQNTKFCSAPTQSFLQSYLRDKVGVMVWVVPTYYDGWLFACNVTYPNGDYETVGIEDGDWNDQLEEGLKKAYEFLNKKLKGNEKI